MEQRSMVLQALMSPGCMWFSGLNTFACIQYAGKPYFIKVKRPPSCASNNHAGRHSLWFWVRWNPFLLWPIEIGNFITHYQTCVCVYLQHVGGVTDLHLAALISVSQLVLLWPQIHSFQPDDWFWLGAVPTGLIKSKCKLTHDKMQGMPVTTTTAPLPVGLDHLR